MKASLLALGLITLSAPRVDGQSPPKPAPAPAVDPSLAQAQLFQLTLALRELMTAEETYYAEHGQYGRTIGPTGVQVTIPKGVRLTLAYVLKNSWGARATHAQLRGRSCIVYMGPRSKATNLLMTSGRLVAREAGTVTCDKP